MTGRTDGEVAGQGRPGAAYELKFVLDEDRASEVADRLRPMLAMDPHCDPALGGAYAVTSLYCDTAAWSVFYREGEHRCRKYRARRYGQAPEVYLERKIVRDRRVRKRRTPVRLEDLAIAAAGEEAASAWFARAIQKRDLSPVCRVRYIRQALFGETSEGAIRVTFDRAVRGARAGGWSFDDCGPEASVLGGAVICELKFHHTMPALLKRLVSDLGLAPRGVSKYRTCMAALAPELGAREVAGDA